MISYNKPDGDCLLGIIIHGLLGPFNKANKINNLAKIESTFNIQYSKLLLSANINSLALFIKHNDKLSIVFLQAGFEKMSIFWRFLASKYLLEKYVRAKFKTEIELFTSFNIFLYENITNNFFNMDTFSATLNNNSKIVFSIATTTQQTITVMRQESIIEKITQKKIQRQLSLFLSDYSECIDIEIFEQKTDDKSSYTKHLNFIVSQKYHWQLSSSNKKILTYIKEQLEDNSNELSISNISFCEHEINLNQTTTIYFALQMLAADNSIIKAQINKDGLT